MKSDDEIATLAATISADYDAEVSRIKSQSGGGVGHGQFTLTYRIATDLAFPVCTYLGRVLLGRHYSVALGKLGPRKSTLSVTFMWRPGDARLSELEHDARLLDVERATFALFEKLTKAGGVE